MTKLSRKAIQVHGALQAYLTPRVAPGMAMDIAPIIRNVTDRNFNGSIDGITRAVSRKFGGSLVNGASLAGCIAILNALDELDTEPLTHGEGYALDEKPFDVQRFARQCTARAMREHGLAMDSEEPDPEAQEQRWSWCDQDEEDAIRTFGSDWGAFRARRRRAAAKDATASDAALADASFAARYPRANNIRVDTYGDTPSPRPTPSECVQRAYTALASDDGGFERRVPGGARIKVL